MNLNIQRLRMNYLLAAGHPQPYRARAEMDATASGALIPALPPVLASLFARQSSSIEGLWFIRHLHVTLEVNNANDTEAIARNWAACIGSAVARALERGSDGSDVLWFPTYATFLARFLVDLVNGSAWHKWPYARFDGLRHLPLSAALRSAICDLPAEGRAAIALLPESDRWPILRSLTLQDARSALEQLAQEPAGADAYRARAAIEGMWPFWETTKPESHDAAGEARYALYLLCAASAQKGVVPGQAALALARLARRLPEWSPQVVRAVVDALRRGEVANLYRWVGAGDAEILSPLWQCSPEMLVKIGATLVKEHSPAPPGYSQESVSPESRFTKFGQLFLLAPLIDEMLPAAATADWPPCEGVPADALARFLILAKCCGQASAAAFFADPLARDLLGVTLQLTIASIAQWQRQITPQMRQRFLDSWLAVQRSHGAIGDEAWLLTRLPARRGAIALLIDGRRGLWLDLWQVGPGQASQLAHRLARAANVASARPTVQIVGFEQSDSERAALEAHLQRAGLALATPEEGTTARTGMDEVLARLDKIPADADFLTLPARWRFTPAVERLLSVAAQGLLRRLAWRLPGFAFTSLPYLDLNFLRFPAQLEEQESQRVARLGRPPLHLLLQMTGVTRATYRLSWLDERPFFLADSE